MCYIQTEGHPARKPATHEWSLQHLASDTPVTHLACIYSRSEVPHGLPGFSMRQSQCRMTGILSESQLRFVLLLRLLLLPLLLPVLLLFAGLLPSLVLISSPGANLFGVLQSISI